MKKMVQHKLKEKFQKGLKQFIMSSPKERSSWIKTEKSCLTNNKQKVSDDLIERSFRRVTGAEVRGMNCSCRSGDITPFSKKFGVSQKDENLYK